MYLSNEYKNYQNTPKSPWKWKYKRSVNHIVSIEDIGQLNETPTVQLDESSKSLNHVKDVHVKGIEKFDTYPICFKSTYQGKIK